jgi:hypothetical protein
MGLRDDRDIIRGLGYVALYAGYLEEGIDECVVALSLTPSKQPASKKARHCIKQAKVLGVGVIADALKRSIALLERRNEVIHGRLYGQVNGPDIRRSGRIGKPAVEVTSAELYALADDIFEAVNLLGHVAGSYTPDAIKNRQAPPRGGDA